MKGMTLLELVITLTAAAVMAAAAVPPYRAWYTGLRLRSAVDELCGDIRLARVSAVRADTEFRVAFDTAASGYRLESGGQAVKSVDLKRHGDSVSYCAGQATFGATVSAGPVPVDGISLPGNRIRFDSRGITTSMGYIYLCDSRGDVWAVGIVSLAGIQVVKHWDGSGWR